MERARDIGIPFEGVTGLWNSITDVIGVEVGYSTLIYGDPTQKMNSHSRFARTGVTAILPRGHKRSAVFAGRHDLNGNGELTGTHWIDDSGFLHGPILLTNTNSVGTVRDAASKWMIKNKFFHPSFVDGKEVEGFGFFYPTVAETYDGVLNNVNGFMIKEINALEALDSAKSGPVEEGNVGGGTGMRCFNFKGGTGTASRVVKLDSVGTYTLGALVQANFGARDDFTIKGIKVGRILKGYDERIIDRCIKEGDGSIIVIIATDAPLMPWQLRKLCRRVTLGLGQLGGGVQNGSGDIFLAFSTANEAAYTRGISTVQMLSDELMDGLYRATAQVTEEAVLNAMFAAESMLGRNFNFTPAIPHDAVKEIFKYNKEVSGGVYG